MVSMAPSTMRPQTPTEVPAASAAKSLLRRSTLVRKRSDNDSIEPSSMDDSSTPPSPSKRARVAFDNDVTVRTMGEDWEKSPAVVKEEVRRAIVRHVSGDSEAYDRIKQIYSTDLGDEEKPSRRSLKNHLLALIGNLSLLDRSAGGLVRDVIESDWLGRDEPYVRLFVHFLGNLVSTHGGWCSHVMSMLVEILCDVPKEAGHLPDYPIVRRADLFNRAQIAIQYIVESVPSTLQVLPDIISKTFPTEHWSTNAPVVYTRNILRLLDVVPQIQSDVLTLITGQLVKIDVHVQIDVEDLDDEMSESIVQEISKRDDDDFESGSESDEDDDDLDSEALRLKTVKMNIIRMDMIIDILFEYYAPVFASQTTSAKDSALDLLLSQFHNIILPSSRSRHTQFLLFHFAQTSTLLIDRFASTCINIILNKNQPQLFRQSAAAYLGSFIARGNRVPSHVVRDVFELLAQQLNALRMEHDPTCRGPDLRRYSVFYSVAQAMIYMFCFRWRDLASSNPDDNASDDEDDPSDAEEDRDITFSHTIKDPLRAAIYSKLNPLKICSPPIVTEFAKIANHLRFLYVYPLLETNKRLRLASVRSLVDMADRSASRGGFSLPSEITGAQNAWGGEESKWQLDAFFPFDPYHLPRSQRWVEGDYREWKGMDDGKEEEQDDDEESADESEAEEDVVGMDAIAAPKLVSA